MNRRGLRRFAPGRVDKPLYQQGYHDDHCTWVIQGHFKRKTLKFFRCTNTCRLDAHPLDDVQPATGSLSAGVLESSRQGRRRRTLF